MERQVKFIVKIGYSSVKKFEFSNIEEATHFAVTAKKTAIYDVNVNIDIEFVETVTEDKEEE